VRQVKVVVEKHPDGFVAYPLGLTGVAVGQGNTYEEALSDLESVLRSHVEAFGTDVLEEDTPLLDAFLTEAVIAA